MAGHRVHETNTESVDDYLKALFHLGGDGTQMVSGGAIAQRLDVAPASVTNMIQKLAAGKPPLVLYERHGGARLSARGRLRALEVIRHHRLLETFLHRELGYPIHELHNEAERLEHFISERFESRLAKKLGNPQADPHGHCIPAKNGSMPKSHGTTCGCTGPSTMRLALCFFLLVSSLLVRPAHADAVSKARKVREMLVALRLEETTNRLEKAQEDRITAMSKQQLAAASPDPDQQKSYEEFRRKVIDLLRESAGWKALEPDFIKLYSDAYSEEEIDGILAFYRSPVGRTMLAKTVELTDNAIAISQRRMTELSPKIQKLIEQYQLEMQ